MLSPEATPTFTGIFVAKEVVQRLFEAIYVEPMLSSSRHCSSSSEFPNQRLFFVDPDALW